MIRNLYNLNELVFKIKKVNSILLIRLFIFITAFSGMLIGPVSRQLIGSSNQYLRPWRMFSGWGRNICDVKYYLTDNNMDFISLDPYEFMKSDNWLDAPRKIRNLKNPKQVKLNAKKMCKLIPEGQTLYVESKCGQKRKGWKLIISKDKPFCTKNKIYFENGISK